MEPSKAFFHFPKWNRSISPGQHMLSVVPDMERPEPEEPRKYTSVAYDHAFDGIDSRMVDFIQLMKDVYEVIHPIAPRKTFFGLFGLHFNEITPDTIDQINHHISKLSRHRSIMKSDLDILSELYDYHTVMSAFAASRNYSMGEIYDTVHVYIDSLISSIHFAEYALKFMQEIVDGNMEAPKMYLTKDGIGFADDSAQ